MQKFELLGLVLSGIFGNRVIRWEKTSLRTFVRHHTRQNLLAAVRQYGSTQWSNRIGAADWTFDRYFHGSTVFCPEKSGSHHANE